MPTTTDFSLVKLAAGVAGAAVSLHFVHGTFVERLGMAFGGAALSYYTAAPLAAWMGATDDTAMAVAFLVGLLGMTLVSKVYAIIEMLDAKQVASDIWDTIKRKWGA